MGEGATADATDGEKVGVALESGCGDEVSAVPLSVRGVGVLVEGVVGVPVGKVEGAAGSCT